MSITPLPPRPLEARTGVSCSRHGAVDGGGGRVYFPCGTPDLSDVTPDRRVDFEASHWRELAEETGLTRADIARERRLDAGA